MARLRNKTNRPSFHHTIRFVAIEIREAPEKKHAKRHLWTENDTTSSLCNAICGRRMTPRSLYATSSVDGKRHHVPRTAPTQNIKKRPRTDFDGNRDKKRARKSREERGQDKKDKGRTTDDSLFFNEFWDFLSPGQPPPSSRVDVFSCLFLEAYV